MSQPILVLRVLALDYCFVLRTLFLDLTGVRSKADIDNNYGDLVLRCVLVLLLQGYNYLNVVNYLFCLTSSCYLLFIAASPFPLLCEGFPWLLELLLPLRSRAVIVQQNRSRAGSLDLPVLLAATPRWELQFLQSGPTVGALVWQPPSRDCRELLCVEAYCILKFERVFTRSVSRAVKTFFGIITLTIYHGKPKRGGYSFYP